MTPLQPVLAAVGQEAASRSAPQVQAQRESARYALEHCAHRCGAPIDGWEKTNDGAPRPNGAYHWSVSHKRHWSAAVIADRPVGIDIEAVVPRPRRLHDELAAKSEWAVVGDRSWDSFFRLWTAKEATLKANGLGIGALLRCRLVAIPDDQHMTLEFDGQRWRVEHYLHAGHVAAVTCGAAPVEWCVLAEPPAGGSAEAP